MAIHNKWLNDYTKEHTFKIFKTNEPCPHKGCYNHVITPCELCGRIGMQGDFKINIDDIEKIKNRRRKINKLYEKNNWVSSTR